MPLNTRLLCKTSTWHNNCGLNGLANFLAYKLDTGELIRKFSNNPNYIALLDSFKEYYDLPTRPTWEAISRLFKTYFNPREREMIFAPVLRHNLGKVISRKAQALWEVDVAAALTEYLTIGQTSDIAKPIFHSNEGWFKKLKEDYDRALSEKEKAGTSLTDFEKLQASNQVLDKIRGEAKEKWMNEGCQAYADRMSKLCYSEMVSAEQLIWIGEALGISIEIYLGAKTEAPLLCSQGSSDWELKFHNTQAHWEFEQPNKDAVSAAQHNFYYNSYYNTSYSADEAQLKKMVKNAITEKPQPFVVDKTEQKAQIAMNTLVDAFENSSQKKEIFEEYFHKFEAVLSKSFSSEMKEEAVNRIVDEINDLLDNSKDKGPSPKKRKKI